MMIPNKLKSKICCKFSAIKDQKSLKPEQKSDHRTAGKNVADESVSTSSMFAPLTSQKSCNAKDLSILTGQMTFLCEIVHVEKDLTRSSDIIKAQGRRSYPYEHRKKNPWVQNYQSLFFILPLSKAESS